MKQNELECINGQSDLEHLEEMALSSDFAHTEEINDSVNYLKGLLLELQKYKQLEKEIGCALEVLFNALKYGVYAREDDSQFYKYEMQQVRGIGRNGLSCISKNAPYPECDFTLFYINYKKTWWLKADKSE